MILPPLATCALGAHPYCYASDAQLGRHVVMCLSDKRLLVVGIVDDNDGKIPMVDYSPPFWGQYLLNANLLPVLSR